MKKSFLFFAAFLISGAAIGQCQKFNTVRSWDTFGPTLEQQTTTIQLDTIAGTITISEGLHTWQEKIINTLPGLNNRFTVYVTESGNYTISWLSWSTEPVITSVAFLPAHGWDKQYYNQCWANAGN